ncbi:MAG TPA: RNA polymerase sigma factor [Pirellulaceae bacterium]
MSDPLEVEAEEEERVRGAVAGDRDSLTALLKHYGPPLQERLRNEIGGRWPSRLDAEDVLQVTFLECFLRIHTFEHRGPGSFQAWISRIGRHNLLDAIRSLERATEIPQGQRVTFRNQAESSLALVELLGVTSETPSRHVSAQETHERLREAVARLPRDYGQVLTLYDLESQSMDEVANRMGRTAGAVYMLRARALDYLRETLGSESRL